MSVDCRIEVELPDERKAFEVARSISLDNGEYVRAEVFGRKIVLTMSASTPASMLHTVEDLLACVKVAESVIAPEEGPGTLSEKSEEE
ncbi:MAG TPA: KEOPS complex subunit Pcc1 [Methanomassiliicoccales archaeon]|nr:KEOPS complex subunit Pcc1 [Methanomassiliicoccales archaeon]